jgi:hypothetical protein
VPLRALPLRAMPLRALAGIDATSRHAKFQAIIIVLSSNTEEHDKFNAWDMYGLACRVAGTLDFLAQVARGRRVEGYSRGYNGPREGPACNVPIKKHFFCLAGNRLRCCCRRTCTLLCALQAGTSAGRVCAAPDPQVTRRTRQQIADVGSHKDRQAKRTPATQTLFRTCERNGARSRSGKQVMISLNA